MVERRRNALSALIMPHVDISPIARALGRIPSGLYIVTTLEHGRPSGFLGSFVMQVGFDPPTVCVAVGKMRPQLAAIRASGRFAISILDPKSRRLMAPFASKSPDGASPFDGIGVSTTPGGIAVLTDALGWIECCLKGEHPTGDHVVMFGEVTAGDVAREGEPCTHVRKNGLSY
jgi:flavin reductase (DIM6/NTAB) family NADH-FMN oxidoreductase RutF